MHIPTAEVGGKSPSLALEHSPRELLRLCNSYSRLPMLIDLWHSCAIEWDEWLTVLGEHWTVCDNISAFADELLSDTPLIEAIHDPDARRLLMSPPELKSLASLPEEVVVWRGCYSTNKWGLSWSLQRELATEFPTLSRYRQDGQALLVKARVLRKDILALKLDRNEAEVIAWRGRGSSLKHVSTVFIRAHTGEQAGYVIPLKSNQPQRHRNLRTPFAAFSD